MRCEGCGAPLDNVTKCPYCGRSVNPTSDIKEETKILHTNKCPGFPIFCDDFDPEKVEYRYQIKCSVCGRKTRILRIPLTKFVELGGSDQYFAAYETLLKEYLNEQFGEV